MAQWVKEPDGEYGEERTVLADGRTLVIHTDKNGEQWDAYIDGEDGMWSLDAHSAYTAREEALKCAMGTK